ncbi:MAG: hypothetical protein ACYCX4_01685 [Bacillota bacterium]
MELNSEQKRKLNKACPALANVKMGDLMEELLNTRVAGVVAAVAAANAVAAAGTGAEASGTTGVEGNNNGLTYTAREKGYHGNGIKIELKNPLGNNQALAVTVANNNITVSLATDAGGAITSTATLVAAAIAADATANALVAVTNTGASTGAGVVTAQIIDLTGGADAAVPTKTEFDAVVTLLNETKAQINTIIVALKNAGLMATS